MLSFLLIITAILLVIFIIDLGLDLSSAEKPVFFLLLLYNNIDII